jgi:hypothetical protein
MDKLSHPPVISEVRLEGSTTIDDALKPCSGRIRLRRYPDHIAAQWGMNRKDGTLTAQQALTIPLDAFADGDDLWGASLQRVLDQIRAYAVCGAPVFQIYRWSWVEQSFDRQQVRLLIEFLRAAMEHKGMVFGSAEIPHFLDWFMGFSQGISFAGLTINRTPESIWWSVAHERGWALSSQIPWWQMREKGMCDDAIIDEILTIEIEAWRQTYRLEDTPYEQD